jgi:hypothetical protein
MLLGTLRHTWNFGVELLPGCNKEWTKEGKKMRIRAAAKDFIWCLCNSRDPSFIGLQEKNEVIKKLGPSLETRLEIWFKRVLDSISASTRYILVRHESSTSRWQQDRNAVGL